MNGRNTVLSVVFRPRVEGRRENAHFRLQNLIYLRLIAGSFGPEAVIAASRKQSFHAGIYRLCLPSMAASYADAPFSSSKFSSPGRPKPSA